MRFRKLIIISIFVSVLVVSQVQASFIDNFFGNLFESDDFDCKEPDSYDGYSICYKGSVWTCEEDEWVKDKSCENFECIEKGDRPYTTAICECTCYSPYGSLGDRICGSENEIRECQMNEDGKTCYWYLYEQCDSTQYCENGECNKKVVFECANEDRYCGTLPCCQGLSCCPDNICRHRCEDASNCESDCTYDYDNICHKICEGRNGCSRYFEDKFDDHEINAIYFYKDIYYSGKSDECAPSVWRDFDGDNEFDLSGNPRIIINSGCTNKRYPDKKIHYYRDICPSECPQCEKGPENVCESDCTYTNDNTCHKECDGINDCNMYYRMKDGEKTFPFDSLTLDKKYEYYNIFVELKNDECTDYGFWYDYDGNEEFDIDGNPTISVSEKCDMFIYPYSKELEYSQHAVTECEEHSCPDGTCCQPDMCDSVIEGYCADEKVCCDNCQSKGDDACVWEMTSPGRDDLDFVNCHDGVQLQMPNFDMWKAPITDGNKDSCNQKCREGVSEKYFCKYILNPNSGFHYCYAKKGSNREPYTSTGIESEESQLVGENIVNIVGEIDKCLIIITNHNNNPLKYPIVRNCEKEVLFQTKSKGIILVRVISFEPEIKLFKKYIKII